MAASIKKAVITAADLGTRLLRNTKEIPKEMLPLFDLDPNCSLCLKPVIHKVFETLYEVSIREFRVVGVDVDPRKVESVNSGRFPIEELGVVESLPHLVREGLVEASRDYEYVVSETEASFVAVNTLLALDGRADLSQLEVAVRASVGCSGTRASST